MSKKNRNGIVYSTDPNYQYDYGNSSQRNTLPPEQQTLYLRREVRNGKPVIVIKEFIGKNEDLKELEKKLKNHCGVGGSNKDGDILIQGENKEKIQAFLVKLGYKTKG
ncbi:MAG: translation initiation factor [Bacteroidetes bacterium]|nr:translation initiation factor [Bacteroidota bacterium]